MEQAGITSLADQILWALPVGCAKLAGELISVPLLDTQGRRPMLLIGGFMQSVSLFFLSLSFLFEWGFASTIIFISSFMFFFEVAAPISWLMPSEVYSTGKRGKAQSIAVTLNRIVSGVIAVSFLSLSRAVTVPGTFFLFCGIAALVTAWYYFVVPETKGMTLEEITILLNRNQKGSSVGSINSVDESGYDSVVRDKGHLRDHAMDDGEIGEHEEEKGNVFTLH